MKRTLLLATASVAFALQGCGTFYAEAEQPRVCLTLTPQTFTIPGGGAVAPPGGFTATYSGTIELSLSNAIPDFMLTGRSTDRILHFLSFDASVSGPPGANLNFVSSLEVTAEGAPGSTPVVLGRYARGSQTGVVTSISIQPEAQDNNLSDFVANGGITLGMSGGVSVAAGQPVPANLTTAVTTCLSAKVHKTFQEIIDGT
jgi:hypothetical protein